MWITPKPNFTLQWDKAFAKAIQSFGLIKRTFTHLTKESFLTLYSYKTYIHSHDLCSLYGYKVTADNSEEWICTVKMKSNHNS